MKSSKRWTQKLQKIQESMDIDVTYFLELVEVEDFALLLI